MEEEVVGHVFVKEDVAGYLCCSSPILNAWLLLALNRYRCRDDV